MRNMGIILILLCLALIGCMVIHPKSGRYEYTTRAAVYDNIRIIPIWIDGKFSAEDLVMIESAIDSWNYALNGSIKLEIRDDHFNMEISKILDQIGGNGWLIMKISGSNKMIPSVGIGYRCIGFAERIGGHHLYLVRDRLKDDQVFGVTMHEMGHLLGSGHVGKRLMKAHFDKVNGQCIDFDTVEAVAKYNKIDVNGLNYCYDK